jgi:hypothetical protein
VTARWQPTANDDISRRSSFVVCMYANRGTYRQYPLPLSLLTLELGEVPRRHHRRRGNQMRNDDSMLSFLVLISFTTTTRRHYYDDHHHHATLPRHSTTMARMVRISDDYDGRKTKRRMATPVAVRHCHLFRELVPPLPLFF